MPPNYDNVALLWCSQEVEYPRWSAYLRALGYTVNTVVDQTPRGLLDLVAASDTIVVTSDWYNNETSNLVLLLGRFAGCELKAAWDNAVGGGGPSVEALVDITEASINPVEIGKVFRNG